MIPSDNRLRFSGHALRGIERKMIRHCVFIRFRRDVDATERAAILADLEALRRVIDGMGKVEFSANASPEPFAHGFTHGFTGWSRRLKAALTG
jgi:hypothetical protein